MKRIPSYILPVLILFASCLNNSDEPPAPCYPVPAEAQLAWHEMEMNAFIHFTMNTFTGLEWGMGNEPPELFNPGPLDVKQWVNVLQNAGFKGMILTCKHHDGFCLWPSKYTNHSVQYSPYRQGAGDIVKEVSDACRNGQMKFGIYLSPWDRHHSDYANAEYITYYRNQLKELLTSYGPVFEMWFDGANGGTGYYGGANELRTINRETYYDWPATIDLAKRYQPDIIFFSDAGPGARWCGNEEGWVNETNWALINPDTLYAGKPGLQSLLSTGSEDGTQWIPAEVDVSIRPGWFYHEAENDKVKTPEQLFEIYLTSVGRGALLLLNVPPDKRGKIHETDQRVLQGFRNILNNEFKANLALKAKVTATGHRYNSRKFRPANITDTDKNSYWTTDDTIASATVSIDFGMEQKIQYIVLQEYIRLGQRVKSFEIEVMKGNKWVQAASATTIGYKRIIRVTPVETRYIKVNITAARACPLISNIEIY